MVRKLIIGAALTAGLFLGASAQAQTVTQQLQNGGSLSFSVGGWNVTINSCGLTLSGVNQNGNCTPEQVVATVVSGGLQLVYQNRTTPSTLFSGGQLSRGDLAVIETITAPSGQMIMSVATTLAGTSSASGVNAGAGVITAGVSGSVGIAAGTTGTSTLTQILGAASNSVIVSKDIFAGSALVSGSATVTSVTQLIRIPEPATMSVLAVGLAGLAGLRRRARKA